MCRWTSRHFVNIFFFRRAESSSSRSYPFASVLYRQIEFFFIWKCSTHYGGLLFWLMLMSFPSLSEGCFDLATVCVHACEFWIISIYPLPIRQCAGACIGGASERPRTRLRRWRVCVSPRHAREQRVPRSNAGMLTGHLFVCLSICLFLCVCVWFLTDQPFSSPGKRANGYVTKSSGWGRCAWNFCFACYWRGNYQPLQ